MNELPSWIRSNTAMFADDTKIWRKISKVEDATLLQEDLNKLRAWTKTSLMDFNVDKCKVMHVNHSLGTSYTLERDGKNCRLLEVREERDLGVMVRSDLKVELQCEKAAAKASSVLGLINRHFKDLDIDSFRILYKSFVRSHLEYCVQVWSPYLRKDIEILEKVQRKATRLVTGMRKTGYEERLRVIGLQTLEQRRIRGDMLEVYKILTGREDVDWRQYFVRSDGESGTRGHSLKLYKPRCRTSLRAGFFSQRIVENWNRLPREVVEAPSMCSFKARYDRWKRNEGNI